MFELSKDSTKFLGMLGMLRVLKIYIYSYWWVLVIVIGGRKGGFKGLLNLLDTDCSQWGCQRSLCYTEILSFISSMKLDPVHTWGFLLCDNNKPKELYSIWKYPFIYLIINYWLYLAFLFNYYNLLYSHRMVIAYDMAVYDSQFL